MNTLIYNTSLEFEINTKNKTCMGLVTPLLLALNDYNRPNKEIFATWTGLMR